MKNYLKPEVELIKFTSQDVITASDTGIGGGLGGDDSGSSGL